LELEKGDRQNSLQYLHEFFTEEEEKEEKRQKEEQKIKEEEEALKNQYDLDREMQKLRI